MDWAASLARAQPCWPRQWLVRACGRACGRARGRAPRAVLPAVRGRRTGRSERARIGAAGRRVRKANVAVERARPCAGQSGGRARYSCGARTANRACAWAIGALARACYRLGFVLPPERRGAGRIRRSGSACGSARRAAAVRRRRARTLAQRHKSANSIRSTPRTAENPSATLPFSELDSFESPPLVRLARRGCGAWKRPAPGFACHGPRLSRSRPRRTHPRRDDDSNAPKSLP
jgi:hypothetical protein